MIGSHAKSYKLGSSLVSINAPSLTWTNQVVYSYVTIYFHPNQNLEWEYSTLRATLKPLLSKALTWRRLLLPEIDAPPPPQLILAASRRLSTSNDIYKSLFTRHQFSWLVYPLSLPTKPIKSTLQLRFSRTTELNLVEIKRFVLHLGFRYGLGHS